MRAQWLLLPLLATHAAAQYAFVGPTDFVTANGGMSQLFRSLAVSTFGYNEDVRDRQ